MAAFRSEQRHLTIRGRTFHFVSYEGHPGDVQRAKLPYPPMWYLMVEGRRCAVLPCDPALAAPQLDAALSAWVEDNALGPVEPPAVRPTAQPAVQSASPRRRCENWWGPN